MTAEEQWTLAMIIITIGVMVLLVISELKRAEDFMEEITAFCQTHEGIWFFYSDPVEYNGVEINCSNKHDPLMPMIIYS